MPVHTRLVAWRAVGYSLASVACLVAGSPDAWGCSTFILHDAPVLLVGHNLDETPGFDVPGLLCINKRGVSKRSVSWADIIAPPKDGGARESDLTSSLHSGMVWVSEYGSVTLNTEGMEFPDCGMNEAGLVVCEMSLRITRFPTDEDRPTIFMSQWIQYLLDTCSTVEEVTRSAGSTNLDGWSWHFMAADASGAGVVVEFVDGEVLTYSGDRLPVPVLCNASYAYELRRLGEHEESVITRALSGLFSGVPRFVRASRMLDEYDRSSGVSPHDYGWKVLEEVRIRGWNKWSILFDVPDRCICFNTEGDRGTRRLSFESTDFSCREPGRLLDVHSSRPGDVSADLVDYSHEANLAFLRRRAELVFAERLRSLAESGVTAEVYAQRLAQYPETTSCDGGE